LGCPTIEIYGYKRFDCCRKSRESTAALGSGQISRYENFATNIAGRGADMAYKVKPPTLAELQKMPKKQALDRWVIYIRHHPNLARKIAKNPEFNTFLTQLICEKGEEE
jgi:hypothetical protein